MTERQQLEPMLPHVVMNHISRWLKVASESGYGMPSEPGQFSINMRKSALLKRLLSGEEPFPFAPPKSYSYPNYSLLENGSKEGYMDVWVSKEVAVKEVVIDQYPWELIKKKGKRNWLVRYNSREGSIWELSPLSMEEIQKSFRSINKHLSDEKVVEHCVKAQDKYYKLACVSPGENTPEGQQ